MNDFDEVAESEANVERRRFPIVRQLLMLGAFLLLLFIIATGSPQALYLKLTGGTEPTGTGSGAVATALPAIDTVGPFDITGRDVRLTARSAFVYDVTTKRVLYSKNPDEVLPLASITKLMTALVAFELVSSNEKASVPPTATSLQSASGLRSGEVFSVRKLTDLALLSSSNDAAYSLANAVGAQLGPADTTEQFVAAMNIRAAELGFSSMSFLNMTGLDQTSTQAGAFGSARETSFLLEYMLEHYPGLLPVTTEQAIRVFNDNGDFHDAENTNPVITAIPNIRASKTGYTDLAGGNLVVAFDAGFNRTVIVTVLGSSRQGRFDDVLTLVKAVTTVPAE